jgi:phage head maturation protease
VNGVRRLSELKLWEISLVTFPMNEMATVTSVKSLDYGREIREFRELLADCREAVS